MGADICVVMNEGSGKEDAVERHRALEAACANFPGRFEVRVVGRGDDLEAETRRAMDEGFAIIVAAGGDGTIAAVAGCLAGSDHTMAVLAMGTFNYFARSLGIPEDMEEAVRLIAEGEPRRLDIGEVNGRVFLNNASLGAYPAILDERERTFRRIGRSRIAAYAISALTLLRFRSALRGRLTAGGTTREVRTPLVFVSKNAGQLETVGLEEGADCVRAGRFAVFVAPDAGRFALMVFALRLVLGLSEPREDFDLLCGDEVVLETHHPRRLVARDGEREMMRGPFVFRLHPKALSIILPPGEPEPA